MSIRKRHGVWHCDVVVQHGGKEFRLRKSCKTTNKSEALAFEAREREKLISKRGVSTKAPFFSDFADEFMSTYAAANNKPSEVASKKNSLKHLTPAFGHLRLDDIGVELIERYKAYKLVGQDLAEPLYPIPVPEPRKPLSPKSVNNHLICLAKLFAVAVEWGKIVRAPKIKLLKVGETDFDFLDFAEADRLVEAASRSGSPWYQMILMALRTGMRISELIAIEWGDVDLKAGTIMVRRGSWNGQVGTPKGGKPKPVPITPVLRAQLTALASKFAGKLVFPGPGGKMLSREACRRPLEYACARAGLRRVGWHVLRHTFCSHLAIRGVPIKTIQELARHASIAMTLRYSHLTPDVREDAINLLDGEPECQPKARTKTS